MTAVPMPVGTSGTGPGAALGTSATAEWTALVGTAVVGTDRRMPPPAEVGWSPWATADDPAVALLDRAAAVVVARHAGALPDAAPDSPLPVAPVDRRPHCPPACAVRLQRILGGQHEALLPEWLEQCDALDVQLPWAALPTLLLRGRRHPELDQVVRRVSCGRAGWLAEVVPELGVASAAAAARPPSSRSAAAAPSDWGRPTTLADSGAVVSAMVQVFVDGLATWAAAPQLRLTTMALDPVWLPSLVAELSRLAFHPGTERTRAEVLGLAEFRHAMLVEFRDGHAHPILDVADVAATPSPRW